MKKRGAIQRTSQTVEKLCFSTRKGSLREIPSKLKYAKNQDMCLIFGSLQGLAR